MMEKSCDILVVGGGGSGLVAAVRAAQLSGKKVIVLEKLKKTGGGMTFASTMRTFGSRWQAERNLPDVTASYLRKVMDASYWRLDPKLAGNAIRATGKFFDWFCDLAGGNVGEQFREGRYVFDDESGPIGPQMGGPGGVTGSGRLFMDTLREKCDLFGVEVLTGHPAVDCEVEDGKVKAVLAEGPDGIVRITCDTCILSCGSWINNPAIVQKYYPQLAAAQKHMGRSPHTNPAYTGDGFLIADKVEAERDEKNFTIRMMGPMVMSRSGVMANMSNSPFSIAVNTLGKRYICEPSQPRCGVFNSGLVQVEQPEGQVYILFDGNNLKAAIQDNLDHPKPPSPGIFGLPPLPTTAEDAAADIALALEREHKKTFSANTIEELAALIGVDPQALTQTVADYNRYCAEGFDGDCFKEAEYLVPFTQPPYYAIKAELGTDGAFGGVLVNGNMQAYRRDGSLIDGLYVTGDFASGRFVNMTGVKVQLINDMSWALASGFIAGTQAAGL